MPNIEVAVQFAEAQDPKPYCTHRPISEYWDCYDCSALYIAGIRHMCDMAGVPWVIPASVGNTVDLYWWAKKAGALVSVTKGVSVRGAGMLKGRWWGYGPNGHVSYSLGNGREFAAHGFSSGIHESNLDAGFYNDAIIIPNVIYGDLAPPVDPEVLKALAVWEAWGRRLDARARAGDPLRQGEVSNDATMLNNLLIRRGLLAKANKSNLYSKYTRAAVHRGKLDAGFVSTDGTRVGGIFALFLLRPT